LREEARPVYFIFMVRMQPQRRDDRSARFWYRWYAPAA
jgi:hypothetical protein